MMTPYTQAPFDAFMIAQECAGLALSAIVLHRAAKWPFKLPMLASIWVAVLSIEIPRLRQALWETPTTVDHIWWMKASALLATCAALTSGSASMLVLAGLGEWGLWSLCGKMAESYYELAALHLAWIGVLLGVHWLATTPRPAWTRPPEPPSRTYLVHDLAMAALATIAGAVTSVFVLHRMIDSADEWAYTYQAAVFAKGHIYGATPPCYEAFRSFWVFHEGPRMFSQYTPGWPWFMAAFVALRIEWLAGPFSFGILAAGLARIARRATSSTVDWSLPSAQRAVSGAGTIAALATIASSTMLINAGSRFPHIFVCGLLAWSIEAICAITERRPPKEEWRWAVVLGSCLALVCATRPIDGALLGLGIFAYVVRGIVKRRFRWRGVVGTLVPFTVITAVALIVLRLQLGVWFKTGYSMTGEIYPWARFSMSIPGWNDLRWGLPIATGAYCWWPLAPCLGFGGLLVASRGPERRVALMLGLSVFLALGFYVFMDFGRGGVDFGYGPRYQMISIVPMAVGGAVLLAPLWASAMSRAPDTSAFLAGGPIALWAAAACIGAVRLMPLTLPFTTQDVKARSALVAEAQRQHLTNAFVWIEPGTTPADPMDLTQNFPIELYPDQSVIFVRDINDTRQCVREHFPGRRYYRASGRVNPTIVPE